MQKFLKYTLGVCICVCLFLLIITITRYYSRSLTNSSLQDSILQDNPIRSESSPGLNAFINPVNILYVIPGGGSDKSVQSLKKKLDTYNDSIIGYPEWTKRRTVQAFNHYNQNQQKGHAIFLALSAGSMNAPNNLHKDGRIVFECQHTIQHLKRLGVNESHIFGDIFSWDTITNGFMLRIFIEGLPWFQFLTSFNSTSPESKIQVLVFISDFHADRMKASFDWILNLEPSLMRNIVMEIHSVSSFGIKWPNYFDFQDRIQHESNGVKNIHKNMKTIRTISEFHTFLFHGGHQGIFKYLHDSYQPSKGVGW